MQQRTGFRPGGRRTATNADVPVLYYAFDLLYLDGFDWRRVPLEDRKKKLASILVTGDFSALLRSLRAAGKSAVRASPARKDWKASWLKSATAFIRNAAAANG